MYKRIDQIKQILSTRDSKFLYPEENQFYLDLEKELESLENYYNNTYNNTYDDTHLHDMRFGTNAGGYVGNKPSAVYGYTPPTPKQVVKPKKSQPSEAEEVEKFVSEYFSLTDNHGLYKNNSDEIIYENYDELDLYHHDKSYVTEKSFSRLYADGSKVFWIKRKFSSDVKIHNLHGPAVIYENGDVEYWINGQKFSELNFNLIQNGMILK